MNAQSREQALPAMYRIHRYEERKFIACAIYARALAWSPNHSLEPQMKPRHVARAVADSTTNRLWVFAVAMAIFIAVTAVLLAWG